MEERDYEIFSDTMLLGCSVSGEEINAGKIRAMFDFLKKLPYPVNQIVEAINNHYYTSEFPIKPANIVNYIREKQQQAKSSVNIPAMFKAVIKKIQANSYDNINFDCPLIHYAIQQIGGLHRICNCQISELIWIEKEFVKAYEEAFVRNISWNNVPKFLPSPYPGACHTAKDVCLSLEEKPRIERKAIEDKQLSEMTPEQREAYTEKFKKLMDNFSISKKNQKNFSLEVEE